MTRIGLMLATAAVGVAGVLGLAACGPAADALAAQSVEGQALTATGLSADEAVTPAEATSPSAGASADRPRLGRAWLRRHTLHGEVVVETKDGPRTVDVQRGTVTAIDARTMTVKSTDGFTLTWTLGGDLKVFEHRTAVLPSAVKVGTEVGVAGVKDGTTTTARLIVIPKK